MYTTLNAIRERKPCPDGWENLLKHLGKTEADDEFLPILTILDSNGLPDALWCLQAVDGFEKEKRLLACGIAEQALPIWYAHCRLSPESEAYQAPAKAIETARRHANGESTAEELEATARAADACASVTAVDAAYYAARAAYYAADVYANNAAANAAYAHAAAANATAYAASRDHAFSAARAKQEKLLRQLLETTTRQQEK